MCFTVHPRRPMRRGTKRGSQVREWLWTPFLLVDVDIVWTADVDTAVVAVGGTIGGVGTDVVGAVAPAVGVAGTEAGAPAAAALANEVGGAAAGTAGVAGATGVAAVCETAAALVGVIEVDVGAAGAKGFAGTLDAPLFAEVVGEEGCNPLPPPTGALATRSFMDRTALSTLFLGPLM